MTAADIIADMKAGFDRSALRRNLIWLHAWQAFLAITWLAGWTR